MKLYTHNEPLLREKIYRYFRTGFSTIELLIAFSILFLILPPLMLLAFSEQTGTLDVTLVHGGVTRVATQIRDAVASTTAEWGKAPQPWADTLYIQENKVTSLSPCLKQINASTAWSAEHNREQYADAATYVSSFTETKALGGACDPFPPSDAWDNPDSLSSIDVSGSDGTGIAVASINGERYAFVTADPTPLTGDDFIVINASDAHTPTLHGTPLAIYKGLNGVVVANKHAYVLNNDNLEQLIVIDISNPSTPTERAPARRTLPNIVSTCSPAIKPCLSGVSIAYYAGRLYIGTSYIAFGLPTQNHELHVYCVDDASVSGCTPATPVWLGSYNVNRNVHDIAVRSETLSGAVKVVAYLAVSGTTASLSELLILDVTSPGSMSQIGTFNPSGTHYGMSIELLGDTAFLGRERAAGQNKDFILIDVANPTNPTQLSAVKLTGLTGSAYVSEIIARGNFAFVATTDSARPLFVFDIRTPTTPLVVSPCGFTYPHSTRDIAYADDLLFTANRSDDLVRIIHDRQTACGS